MIDIEVDNTTVSTITTPPKDPLLKKESGDVTNSEQRVEAEKSKLDCVSDKPLTTSDKDASSKTAEEKDNTADYQEEPNKGDKEKKPDENYRRGAGYRRNRMSGRYSSRFRHSLEEKQHLWEEQQKKKTVIQQGVTGCVQWYSFRKNYGFIQRDDDSQDVFVHQLSIAKSRIRKPNLRTLDGGEKVQFDVVQGKKGLEASNVTGPNGTDVQGSRIIFIFTDNYDRFNRRRSRFNNYKDYSNRPAYYDNYRHAAYHDRDFRQRNDSYFRYDDACSRYPVNRGPTFAGNHDRSYPRNSDRYYSSKRDHSTENRRDRSGYRSDKKRDELRECQIDKNEKKNEMRPQRGRRQFGRRIYKKRNNQIGGTQGQSETSTKKTTEKTVVDTSENEQNDVSEDLVKGVAAIQVQ